MAPVMLAGLYSPGVDLSHYVVSEKYDGVRGYWDGKQLRTRGNLPISVPAWFTAGWPTTALDGELWAGRGQFAKAVSTVRQQTPDDAAWRDMKFMVFDLPGHSGAYAERLQVLEQRVPAIGQPWVQAVQQSHVRTQSELHLMMESIVHEGGEGVALHRLDSPYRAGRTGELLKYKPDNDADAVVIAHVPGNGKYENMMGALLVETPEGVRFKLGSGFTDAQRLNPPATGSWVSYRYRGENESGTPRFATFLRVRADLPL